MHALAFMHKLLAVGLPFFDPASQAAPEYVRIRLVPEDDIRAANVNQEEAGAMPDVDDTAIAMSASLADAEQVLANSVACWLATYE